MQWKLREKQLEVRHIDRAEPPSRFVDEFMAEVSRGCSRRIGQSYVTSTATSRNANRHRSAVTQGDSSLRCSGLRRAVRRDDASCMECWMLIMPPAARLGGTA